MSEQFRKKGNALFKAKAYQAAADQYSFAIEVLPHPVYYSNRAACYLKLSEPDKAASDCQAGLSKVEEFQKCRNGIPELKADTPVKLTFRWSKALEEQENYSAAIKVCNSGLQTYPGNESLSTQLRKLQWMEKKKERGQKEKAYSKTTIATRTFVGTKSHSETQTIPVHIVEQIPTNLRSIYNSIAMSTSEPPSDDATSAINSFTGQLPLLLPESLNAHTLARLLKSPTNQMKEVRSFLYNYDSKQWPHIFGRGGIDSEFIDQMLKAIIENAKEPSRPKEIMESMKKCERFSIAYAFISQDVVAKMSQIVEEY